MERSPVIRATTEQEVETAAASQPIFHGGARLPVNNCLKQIMRLSAKSNSTPKHCLCHESSLGTTSEQKTSRGRAFGEQQDIWWLHLSHLADQTNKRLKCPRVAEPPDHMWTRY